MHLDTSHAAKAARPLGVPDTINHAFEVGRQCWRAIPLGLSEFYSYLDRFEPLAPLRYPDALYLCAACMLGRPAAARALELSYIPGLSRYVRRLTRDRDSTEEIVQQIRDRLLVGRDAKIGQYRGKGSFAGWLRTIAFHAVADYQRAQRRRSLDVAITTSNGLEVSLQGEASGLLTKFQPLQDADAYAVEAALEQALKSLEPGTRRLLHEYFVMGCSISVLGTRYSVDRSTAARRIVKALDEIRRRVRTELVSSVGGLSYGELGELIAAVYDRLNIDLAVLLPAVDRRSRVATSHDDGLMG